MRKLLLAGLVAMIATAPFASGAHPNDINDASECRNGDAEAVMLGVLSNEDPTTADPEDVDRASVCVNDGEGAVFYIGGEAQSEDNGNEDYGNACGAIIVAGDNVTDSEEDFMTGEGHHHCD